MFNFSCLFCFLLLCGFDFVCLFVCLVAWLLACLSIGYAFKFIKDICDQLLNTVFVDANACIMKPHSIYIFTS